MLTFEAGTLRTELKAQEFLILKVLSNRTNKGTVNVSLTDVLCHNEYKITSIAGRQILSNLSKRGLVVIEGRYVNSKDGIKQCAYLTKRGLSVIEFQELVDADRKRRLCTDPKDVVLAF
jgi:hypothetical protein